MTKALIHNDAGIEYSKTRTDILCVRVVYRWTCTGDSPDTGTDGVWVMPNTDIQPLLDTWNASQCGSAPFHWTYTLETES